MNGNTPYGGLPGVTQAGQRAPTDVPTLTGEQKRTLHEDVTQIAALTRAYLPNEYLVDADISQGVAGPRVRVAVKPPIGHPVTAGFSPTAEGTADRMITADEQTEVARGLAASAALQVKQAISNNVTPTAR